MVKLYGPQRLSDKIPWIRILKPHRPCGNVHNGNKQQQY